MAFQLTSDITIGTEIKIKPIKVSWKTDINSFTDTCTIELPRISYLKNNKTASDDQQQPNKRKEYHFKENDKITILLGYNGRNEKRFEGFIKRVNMNVPVKIECEGYSYLLYDIMFNKTYASVTVKKLLADLCKGTPIVLSKEIPDIPLKNVRFKNKTGIQVLEWLQKECHLSIYFNFNELYAGTLFGKSQATIKFQLGWNTVKEDDLKRKEADKTTRVVVKEKTADGTVKKTKANVKNHSADNHVKIKSGLPATVLKQIASRLQTKSNYNGYQGSITAFLEPMANKGMIADIIDKQYPDRTGKYFIESVSGEFGSSGGRQTIKLGHITSK